jgi:WD40 repeat protein
VADNPDERIDPLCGRRLGDFVLRERIDDGGFGAVYRCDQPKLRREVVVKVAHQRASASDPEALRFLREAQLASRLDHPFAAHVYAFGIEPDDGLVWIAMEMVHGTTLDRWLAGHTELRPDARRELLVPLFEGLADVVHVAHAAGIVHRDIKPSNIMVVERAGKLLPKLLDFGVAKPLHDPVPPATDSAPEPGQPNSNTTRRLRRAAVPQPIALTPRSEVQGTPPYMAPEQWTGGAVGPAADLYAFGVVAYEALVGTRPFRGETIDEFARAHLDDAPPPIPGAPGLDEVFERALAKRPEARYGSALELAAALRSEFEARWVSRVRAAAKQWHKGGRAAALLWRDEPMAALEAWLARTGAGTLDVVELEFVEASRTAAVGVAAARARRALWRRRGLVALWIGSAAAVVVAAEIRSFFQARLVAATRIESEVEQGRAALLHDELPAAQEHLREAHRRGDDSPATRFMLSVALQPLQAEQARMAAASGRMLSATWSPDGSQIVTTDDRGASIWDGTGQHLLYPIRLDATTPRGTYSADGRRLVTASADGSVRIWNPATGSLVRELRAHRRDGRAPNYFAAAVTADARLAAGIDLAGDVAHVWDVATGTVLAELNTEGTGWPVLAFSADARWLALGGGNGVSVLDTGSWQRGATIPGPGIRTAAWSPGANRLLTGSAEGDAAVWEIGPSAAGRVVHLREVGEPVDVVAWAPDGRRVAIGTRDGTVQEWELGGTVPRQLGRANAIHDKPFALEFDRAGARIVVAGASSTAAVLDVATGTVVTTLQGPTQVISAAHFAPDGQRIVGASFDGTARVWDATSPYRHWDAPPTAADCDLVTALEPDSRYLAVACRDLPTKVWDSAQRVLLAELPATVSPGGDFAAPFPAVARDGTRAAIARGDAVEVYELPGGRLLRRIEHGAAVSAVAFGAGHDVLSGDVAGTLRISGDDGAIVARDIGAGVDAVAKLTNDRVIAADARGVLHVLARGARGLEIISTLTGSARVRMLRPSPGGRHLLTLPRIDRNGQPMLWDLAVGRGAELAGQVFGARWVDGNRIITAGATGGARLWDGTTGNLLRTFRGGSRYLADAALDPTGTIVVGGGADGVLRFWDADTGSQLWTTPAYKSPIVGLQIDGEAVITRGFGGEITSWKLPDPNSVIDACRGCDIVPP